MALQPQAAIETAALNAMRAQLGYAERNSGRMFDGRPPAFLGDYYVVVWHDGTRDSTERGSLAERYGLRVTFSLQTGKYPFDRLVQARDLVELKLNEIRALLHKDQYGFAITAAARTLAGYGQTGASLPIGWVEALMFQGFGPCEEKGPEWFGGVAESGMAGVAQTANFGRSGRFQALVTSQ